jgi:diphthamide synthase (EF-2-diphthine--ammonia ligase)
MRGHAEVEVVGLLTTVNTRFARVAMHGVREEVLEAQARAAGLELWKVPIPHPCSNEVYERAMAEVVARAKARGIRDFVFGDLFLQDIREYRERNLAAAGARGHWPIWRRDTDRLAREMVAGGLRATVVCLDPRKMPRGFAGRTFDEEFLRDLPEGVDPCGENGEFHTVVWAGPMFRAPLRVRVGETVEHDGFVFTDVFVVA